MTTEAERRRLNQISHKIIGCAYTVSNTLGNGYLEKVYENALAFEIREAGLRLVQQQPIPVRYKGISVGEYYADLIVEGSVIVELKAVEAIADVHLAQTLNYLTATGLKLALILNFGKPEVEVRRVVRNF